MKEITRRLEVKRLSKLRTKRRKFKAVVIAAACLCSIALFITLVRYDKLLVKNITVAGNSLVSADRIKELVAEKISGNYPLWIPRSSTLFFPKDEIAAAVLSGFLPVGDVSISRNGLNGISVEVAERPTTFIWCGTEPNPEDNCYYVDRTGLVFEKTKVKDGDSLTFFGPIIRNFNNPNDQLLGGQLLSRTEFVALSQLIDAINKTGLELSHVVINNAEVDLYTKLGWPIYAPLGEKLSQSAAIFNAAVGSKAFADTSKFDTLEYFDLRYGNKVYYKHKGDTGPAN